MRRALSLISLLLFSACLLFAGGQGEEETMTLRFVRSGKPGGFLEGEDSEGYAGAAEKVAGKFEEKYPGVKVVVLYRDVTQGSMTVDAMMAKGQPPDVWFDATGYFLNYLNEDYAIPLEKYVDTSPYLDFLIEKYTFNGHVYALCNNNVAGGFAVNLDILDSIGYALPDQPNWTIDEFTRLSGKLKAVDMPSTMITTMDGMNSWIWPWIYAFGGKLFEPGDYSKVAVNTPEAVKGFEYMKFLVDEGYAYPHPNEQSQDDAVDLFTTGQVFSSMMQNGHTDYWLPQQVAQGVIDKEFNLTFIEIPHSPAVEHTEVFGYQTIGVAHRSDDESRNEMCAKLTEWFSSEIYLKYVCEQGGGFTTRKDYTPTGGVTTKPSYGAIAEVNKIAGQMDLGALSAASREASRAFKLPVQAYMAGDITVQEMLDIFEEEANIILGR